MKYIPKEYITPETDPNLLSNEFWNSLVVIAYAVLGINLYDYQCEILRAVAYYDRVACVASRQIGKSVTIAILALCWALAIPEQTIVIISTGERQVKELLTKRNYSIKKVFKRAGREGTIYHKISGEAKDNISPKSMISFIGELAALKLEFVTKHENAEEVEFNNGSRIVVVPANPDTASGYTANLLIGDEIAKMPNWKDMWAACLPFVTRVNGKIALFSSYKGKNHWWDITQDPLTESNPFGWKVLKYTILTNPPSNLEQLKHDLPEEIFNEEYMCIPVDESHSLFPFKLIDECATGSFPEWF